MSHIFFFKTFHFCNTVSVVVVADNNDDDDDRKKFNNSNKNIRSSNLPQGNVQSVGQTFCLDMNGFIKLSN